MLTITKSDLLPHNPRVKVPLKNLEKQSVEFLAKTTLDEVSPCNLLPDIEDVLKEKDQL